MKKLKSISLLLTSLVIVALSVSYGKPRNAVEISFEDKTVITLVADGDGLVESEPQADVQHSLSRFVFLEIAASDHSLISSAKTGLFGVPAFLKVRNLRI